MLRPRLAPAWPFVVAVGLSAGPGCGARSSLVDDDPRASGSGGASGGETSSASGERASSQASSGSGGDCSARDFHLDGPGAVRVRTQGEIAWFTTLDGSVMRADLETGDERTLVSGIDGLGDLAVWDGSVYFSDRTSISRVSVDGGDVTSLVPLAGTTYIIEADGSGIYWTAGPATLGAHSVERLLPDGSRITLATNVQYPFGLSLGPSGVAFADPYDFSAPAGTVRRVPIAGGPSTLLASGVPYPEFPFERDGFVHWVEATDERGSNHGGIGRVPAVGGAREKVMSLEEQYPVFGMTDGAHYFLTVLDAATHSQLVAASYPRAGAQTEIADGGSDLFFTMVATTPKRLVWTVQPGSQSPIRVDGLRTLCLDDIAFL